jgi:hypothetical protein
MNRISTTGRRAHAQAHETGLAQGRVDNPAAAELGQQAVGHLVRPAPLADPLADAEDGLVGGHLLLEGGPQRIAVLHPGHGFLGLRVLSVS